MQRPSAESPENVSAAGFLLPEMDRTEKEFRRKYAAVFLTVAAIAAVTVLSLRNRLDPDMRGQAVLSVLFIFQIFTIVLLSSALKRNLRTDFYSFGNIMVIGAILFETVLTLFLLDYFLSCIAHPEQLGLRAVFDRMISFPRQFSRYALVFFGLVCLLVCVSNVSLIRHEGFRLKNLNGVILSALYIGGTLVLYAATGLLYKKVIVPHGYAGNTWAEGIYLAVTLFLLLLLCYYECVAVGTGILGWAAARKKPAYDKDYIIILGCLISREGGLLPLLKGRVNRAIRYAWDQEIATGRKLIYVPSGGQGRGEIMSEGSAMEFYLLTHGAEQDEVIAEKESANTWENMVFSKRIIDREKPGAKVAFATTNFHVLRSGILARKAGLDAEGIASATKWYFWPNGFVREFFGIMKMNVKAHVHVGLVLLLCSAAAGIIFALCG